MKLENTCRTFWFTICCCIKATNDSTQPQVVTRILHFSSNDSLSSDGTIPWLESTMTRSTTFKLNSQTRKVCTHTLQGWQTGLAVVCEVHQCWSYVASAQEWLSLCASDVFLHHQGHHHELSASFRKTRITL